VRHPGISINATEHPVLARDHNVVLGAVPGQGGVVGLDVDLLRFGEKKKEEGGLVSKSESWFVHARAS